MIGRTRAETLDRFGTLFGLVLALEGALLLFTDIVLGIAGIDDAAYDVLFAVAVTFIVLSFILTLVSRIARTKIPGYTGGIFGVGDRQKVLRRTNQAMFVLWEPISKICFVQQDYSSCRKLGNELLEFLSFGKTKHLGAFIKIDEETVEDKAKWEEFLANHQAAVAELQDLVDIWRSAFQNSLTLGRNANEWKPVKLVAEALGVDIMIESYYDGIPIDAIVNR